MDSSCRVISPNSVSTECLFGGIFSLESAVTKTINKLKKHYNINKSRNYVYTVLNEMTADGIFNSYMMKGCRFYNLKKHETVTIVEGSKR